MINSYLYEAIDIAVKNPIHSAAIVNLLVRRCIQEPLKFEVSFLDDDEQDDKAEAAEGKGGENIDPT